MITLREAIGGLLFRKVRVVCNLSMWDHEKIAEVKGRAGLSTDAKTS